MNIYENQKGEDHEESRNTSRADSHTKDKQKEPTHPRTEKFIRKQTN